MLQIRKVVSLKFFLFSHSSERLFIQVSRPSSLKPACTEKMLNFGSDLSYTSVIFSVGAVGGGEGRDEI